LKDVADTGKIPPFSFISFDAYPGQFFSKLQRFITGKPFTHSALSVPLCGENVVWGADLTVDMQSWDKLSGEDHIVFTPKAGVFTEDQLRLAFWRAFVKYGGMGYGIMELPMFGWRGFCSFVLHINTDKWHNWFPGKVICSQLQLHVLEELAVYKPNIQRVLDQYTSTLYDSGQFFETMLQVRDLGYFEISSKKWSF
jgi:hypothetical protein